MSLPVTCQAGFQLLGLTFAGQKGGVMLSLQVTPVRQDRGLASKTASNTQFHFQISIQVGLAASGVGAATLQGRGEQCSGQKGRRVAEEGRLCCSEPEHLPAKFSAGCCAA